MSSEQKSPANTSFKYVCRSCKQPVEGVVERHKNMGVFVPHWIAGPCHNPRCDMYVPEQIPISSARSSVWKGATGWTGH